MLSGWRRGRDEINMVFNLGTIIEKSTDYIRNRTHNNRQHSAEHPLLTISLILYLTYKKAYVLDKRI